MQDKGASASTPLTVDGLASELTHIAALNTSELRSLVLSTTGKSPSRQISGDLLRRMVAHRAQERALGGLERKLSRAIDHLTDGRPPPFRLKAGSVFIRELNGVMQQVMVVSDGFSWNDSVYPSLSAVAKAMTGTTWNGHRFFGLPQRKRARDVKLASAKLADASADKDGDPPDALFAGACL